MSSDLIEVIIPVYNGAKTIVSAVESIQAQTHRNIVIHVIDDGSEDETPELLKVISSTDPRVRIHRKPNGGIVDALNVGLSLCSADIIARHDADDLAYPERFERQLAYLHAHPDCIAVGSNVRHIDADSQPTGSYSSVGSPENADADWIPSREPYLIHPFLMARRQPIMDIGGYRYVYHAEDTDLYWRLRERGRLHNLEDVLGDYRLHDESISGSSIHNGRMMAVSSQLAGMSAQRRAVGQQDMVFDPSSLKKLKAAGSLTEMLATTETTSREKTRLELAVAAKILELAAYRPYELEQSDCDFIRNAIVGARQTICSPENRKQLNRQLAGTSARLFAGRHIGRAMTVLRFDLYGDFALRLIFRIALPSGLRAALKRRAGLAQAVK